MIDWEVQKEYSKNLLKSTLVLLDEVTVSATKYSLKLNSTNLLDANFDIHQITADAFNEIDFDPIYCIQLVDENNSVAVAKSFEKAKASNYKSRCYSKFNKNNSKTLYVGISEAKSFKKRMREHLGAGAKSTYALNLKYWIPKDIQLEILVFKTFIPVYNKSESMNLLELMEQSLWDKLQPMMGKRSGQL